MRTWHFEMFVVAAALAAVAFVTHGGAIEWVGAAAVLLSFGHAQVADRLAEREAQRETPSVECHRWATRYLVGKETLWCVYFVALGAWSALVGVGLFIAYPAWRRWWRAHQHRAFVARLDDDAIRNACAQTGFPLEDAMKAAAKARAR